MSQRVMSVLNRFTPNMEIYSIDEAFLEFNELKRVDFKQLGHQIIQQVKQITQIPISIGFGKSKTLAKIANRTAKKFPKKPVGSLSWIQKIEESIFCKKLPSKMFGGLADGQPKNSIISVLPMRWNILNFLTNIFENIFLWSDYE